MVPEDIAQWIPCNADAMAYIYYVSVTFVIASVFACCVSSTIRTACISNVLSLVLWRLERKQVQRSGRGAIVSRSADGTRLCSSPVRTRYSETIQSL